MVGMAPTRILSLNWTATRWSGSREEDSAFGTRWSLKTLTQSLRQRCSGAAILPPMKARVKFLTIL